MILRDSKSKLKSYRKYKKKNSKTYMKRYISQKSLKGLIYSSLVTSIKKSKKSTN